MLISSKTCVGKHWKPVVDLSYAQNKTLIPIPAAEMAKAGSGMPLAICKQAGEWQIMAVCGQVAEHNCFIKQGKWLGHYQPQWLSHYPFDFIKVKDQGVLTFEEDSGLLCTATEGEAFFDDQGQPMPRLKAKIDTLSQFQAQMALTTQALNALEQAGVLVAWPEQLKSSLNVDLDGLHFISEQKLNALEEPGFLALRRAQALPIAYAVNFSIQQGHLLHRLAKINPPKNTGSVDIEQFFDEDSDSLKF